MQFVPFAGTELATRGTNHRVGTFRFKDMGQGEPGTPGNFYLRLVWSQGDFFSPRHLHNFDQVRVQLQGTFKFAEDGVMRPGCIGYFPEGTAYGPQTSDDETMQLVLQLGGPSGCGYVSESERVAGVEALGREGVFRDGRYFRHGSTSALGADAFEAVWEHVNGRQIRYPAPRFEKPMLANIAAFPSVPAEASGVRRKVLWQLGARTVGCDVWQLDAASATTLHGPLSAFVLSGHGQVGDAAFTRWDAFHLQPGQAAGVRASEAAEILVFTHPRFD